VALRKDAAEKAALREQGEAARAAKAAAREQERVDREAAEAEAAFLRTPAGRATTAKERCEGFFEIELIPALTYAGRVPDAPVDPAADYRIGEYRGVLADIEAVGWHLEHVTYIREARETGGRSQTTGVYLFRNAEGTPVKVRRRARP
jgi:hypothetical protein